MNIVVSALLVNIAQRMSFFWHLGLQPLAIVSSIYHLSYIGQGYLANGSLGI